MKKKKFITTAEKKKKKTSARSVKKAAVKADPDENAFKEGGKIPNQYRGKTPRQVWIAWSHDQRKHFMHDHANKIKDYKSIEKDSPKFKFDQIDEYKLIDDYWSKSLPDQIRSALHAHVNDGQYKDGGKVEALQLKHKIENELKEKGVTLIEPDDFGFYIKGLYKGGEIEGHTYVIDGEAHKLPEDIVDLIDAYNSLQAEEFKNGGPTPEVPEGGYEFDEIEYVPQEEYNITDKVVIRNEAAGQDIVTRIINKNDTDPGGTIYSTGDGGDYYFTQILGTVKSETFKDGGYYNNRNTGGSMFLVTFKTSTGVAKSVKIWEISKLSAENSILAQYHGATNVVATEIKEEGGGITQEPKTGRAYVADTFTIDYGPEYPGYHVPTERWNGWATPVFEEKVAEKILRETHTPYRWEGEALMYQPDHDPDDTMGHGEIWDQAGPKTITVNGEQKTVYAVGAYNWVWSETTQLAKGGPINKSTDKDFPYRVVGASTQTHDKGFLLYTPARKYAIRKSKETDDVYALTSDNRTYGFAEKGVWEDEVVKPETEPEPEQEVRYIEFLNKEKNFKQDRVEFTGPNSYADAVEWGRKNLENFNTDMIRIKREDGGPIDPIDPTEVTFKSGGGYWDVTKYPYGGDFKRFKGGEKGKLIEGPIKIGGEMRVQLDDDRIIVVNYNSLDMPTHEQKSDFYDQHKSLWTFGYADGGKVDNAYYDKTKTYKHKQLGYTAKYVGKHGKKHTYEIITDPNETGFKPGDQFTPNKPQDWFEIVDSEEPPVVTPIKTSRHQMELEEFKHRIWLIKPFIGNKQFKVLEQLSKGEEAGAGYEIIKRLSDIIDGMPKTYQTDGQKANDKIVYLHYFGGGSDFYIVEKDMEPQQLQAYGYTILNGDLQNAEWGYINIEEIKSIGPGIRGGRITHGIELDFYWTPKTFGEVMGEVKPKRDTEPKGADPEDLFYGELQSELRDRLKFPSVVYVHGQGLEIEWEGHKYLVRMNQTADTIHIYYMDPTIENIDNAAYVQIFAIPTNSYQSNIELSDRVQMQILIDAEEKNDPDMQPLTGPTLATFLLQVNTKRLPAAVQTFITTLNSKGDTNLIPETDTRVKTLKTLIEQKYPQALSFAATDDEIRSKIRTLQILADDGDQEAIGLIKTLKILLD